MRTFLDLEREVMRSCVVSGRSDPIWRIGVSLEFLCSQIDRLQIRNEVLDFRVREYRRLLEALEAVDVDLSEIEK